MTVASYHLPGSLPEALTLLERFGPSLLVMAGGTVVMPLVNEGISLPEAVMGLRKAGLDGISERDGIVRIGATTTITRLLEHRAIPMLADAARNTASWSIRNMATIGGNLFTPPPGGDIAVALLALDAEVTLAGPTGERVLPLASFWTGFLAQDLAQDELVTSISVPVHAGRATFLKFGRKHANTPSVVTVAVHLAMRDDGETVAVARIALGATGPHPMRMTRAEAAIAGTRLDLAAIAEAAAIAATDSEPFTDAVASDWYRRRMVGVIVGRALTSLAEPATPGSGRGA